MPSPRQRAGSWFDWAFRNRQTGQVTIAQFPNIALWVFFATAVLRRVVRSGTPHTLFVWVGLASLGWWALDEVLRGVNPWRRLLGLGGCVLVVAGTLSALR
jgi:hypothetical protein